MKRMSQKYARPDDLAFAKDLIASARKAGVNRFDVSCGEVEDDGEPIFENDSQTDRDILDAMFCADEHRVSMWVDDHGRNRNQGWFLWIPNNGGVDESLCDFTVGVEPLLKEAIDKWDLLCG
jgi:hypothetical protein